MKNIMSKVKKTVLISTIAAWSSTALSDIYMASPYNDIAEKGQDRCIKLISGGPDELRAMLENIYGRGTFHIKQVLGNAGEMGIFLEIPSTGLKVAHFDSLFACRKYQKINFSEPPYHTPSKYQYDPSDQLWSPIHAAMANKEYDRDINDKFGSLSPEDIYALKLDGEKILRSIK